MGENGIEAHRFRHRRTTPENRRPEMLATYTDCAIDFAVDLTAVFLLAYVLYFRRHRRADLLLAYAALNIGIFIAVSLLSTKTRFRARPTGMRPTRMRSTRMRQTRYPATSRRSRRTTPRGT